MSQIVYTLHGADTPNKVTNLTSILHKLDDCYDYLRITKEVTSGQARLIATFPNGPTQPEHNLYMAVAGMMT